MQAMESVRIFIGYDTREEVAFSVLAHSINTRASCPVSIAPLMLSQLKGIYTRARHPLQSTDFSFTRFLAPHLCNYQGWVVFMDCDMLMLDDVANLWALRDERYAVQVVKHHHVPKEETKFLNAPQTKYDKKNWSSVMLFNAARCTALSAEYVNKASGLELHQFKWLESDDLIGEIPHRWNHLVDYDPPNKDVSNVHFTLGGPYFAKYRNCEYSDAWFAEHAAMLRVGQHPAVAPAA